MNFILASHPIFEWQNLLFILPMVMAVFLIILQAAGLGGDHDHDHDHDFDHDHDIHHEPGVHIEHGHSDGFKLLSLFGIGKVPLTIVAVSLCLLWGAGGLVGNFVVNRGPLVAIVVAAAFALIGTRVLSSLISKVMPSLETSSRPGEWYLNKEARVLYPLKVDSGAVQIGNPEGLKIELQARIEAGHAEIPEGSSVILVRFDRDSHCYFVRQSLA